MVGFDRVADIATRRSAAPTGNGLAAAAGAADPGTDARRRPSGAIAGREPCGDPGATAVHDAAWSGIAAVTVVDRRAATAGTARTERKRIG